MQRKRLRKLQVMIALPLIVALGLVLVPAAPASAARPLACVAQGTVDTVPSGDDAIWNWTVQGDGTCIGDFRGPYKVSFEGQGTSVMLGLCDNLVVTDLNLDVVVTIVSRLNNQADTFQEHWFAPITTYPIATPFFIDNEDGRLVGAGAMETRIRANCPPGGAPTAVFEWAQISS